MYKLYAVHEWQESRHISVSFPWATYLQWKQGWYKHTDSITRLGKNVKNVSDQQTDRSLRFGSQGALTRCFISLIHGGPHHKQYTSWFLLWFGFNSSLNYVLKALWFCQGASNSPFESQVSGRVRFMSVSVNCELRFAQFKLNWNPGT